MKIKMVVFLLTLTGMTGLFAQNAFILYPPVLGGSHPQIDVINETLRDEFRNIEDSIRSEIGGIISNPYPQNLIGAFATSSVFSSTGASLRSYQGYNIFALTVGAMAGIQFPRGLFSMFGNLANLDSEMDKMLNDIYESGDIQLGINPQIVNAQFGINTKFLLKGLYLGVKGGYMKLPTLNLNGFKTTFQTWSIGGLVNYQLIPQFRLLGGIFVWRGINLGTGFIYQNTTLEVGIPLPLDTELEPIDFAGIAQANFSLNNTKFDLGFNVNTYTIPLEVVTSFRVLGFLNVSVGMGADIGFGNASLGGGIDSKIDIEINGFSYDDVHQVTPGRLSISMGGSGSPSLLNPKAMTSFGFSAGPAIVLDIPITYYFLDNGYNIGFTLGFAL